MTTVASTLAGPAPTGPRPATHRGRSVSGTQLTWRLIRDQPLPGARNMAVDHALAEQLAERLAGRGDRAGRGPDEAPADGERIVRLYGWSRPTVSWGKNEPASEPLEGLGYVRRPTGGRAVLHDDELTYTVVAPVDAFGGLREAYAEINRVIASAIGALGASVSVAGDGDGLDCPPTPLHAGACFQTPARGEIVAAGRKLVGSAQARMGRVVLQHGSILLSGTQGRMGPVESEPATLSELLGAVRREDLAERVEDAFRKRFGGQWTEDAYRADELEAAARLERERYGRDTWTWRTRREGI